MGPKEAIVGECYRLFEWLVLMRPQDHRTLKISQLYARMCTRFDRSTRYVLTATDRKYPRYSRNRWLVGKILT